MNSLKNANASLLLPLVGALVTAALAVGRPRHRSSIRMTR